MGSRSRPFATQPIREATFVISASKQKRRSAATIRAPLDQPARGEIWWVSLDPTRGREQAGRRPALLLSVNVLNASAAGIVSAVPIIRRDRGIRSHVPIAPPEGGLTVRSYAMCEQLRAIAKERLQSRIGTIAPRTLAAIEDRVRILLDL